MANYKIAIIVGSLRKDSLNRKIARSICAMRGDNLDCQMVEIGDLPLYNQDYDCSAAAGAICPLPRADRGRRRHPVLHARI